VFRHTAFFLFRDDITPEKHLAMLKGLAYMRYECSSVVAIDYGTDLFGGSEVLRTVKPWDRTPRWRGREEGPPCNYDVALQLDFVDLAGNEEYNDDDVHHEVGEYNASICRSEMTARVDWTYEDDAPLNVPGQVRHSAMFVWRDDADDAAKTGAWDAVKGLESAPGVNRVTIGENVGKLKTDFDWIVDLQVDDADATKALIEGDAYAEAMQSVVPATKHEWTARISHTMHGI
jgi:hypothetical protein